jgi:uncharacterized protein involved in outer membrane biogenesis
VRAAKAMASGLALVVLAAGAGAIAISRVDPAAVRDFLSDAARQASGREVVVRGATELQLFPAPTLIAENVVFGNAAWSISPDMARVKRLEARVDVLGLFLGQLRVSRFRLLEPHVLLERDRKGRRNWDFQLAKDDSGEGQFLARMQSQVRMVVSEIQIINGTFSYRDGKVTHTVRIPELSAYGDVAGGPLKLTGRGQLNGQGWKLTGSVGELSTLLRNKPYDLAFVLATPGIEISAEGAIQHPLEGAGLRMGLELEARSARQLFALAGLDADVPGPVQASAELSDRDGVLRLDKLRASIRIEGGRVTASGAVDDLVDGRGVKVDLAMQAKSLDAIQRVTGLDLPKAGPLTASATISNPKGRFRMDGLSARIALHGATLNLSGKLTHLAGGRGLDVGIDLKAASLARLSRYLDVPLPAVGPVTATARLSLTKHGYKLAQLDARVGRSDAVGELYVYPHRKRVRVVGSLKSKKLDLDQLLPATVRRGGKRIFSGAPFSLAWLRAFDGEVSVHARKLHIQGMVMDKVKAGMALSEGRLQFTPRGTLGGGTFNAKLSADVGGKRAHVAMRIRGKGIGLGKVSEQIYATKFMEGGSADINIDVAGRGNSVQELMADLSGGIYVAAGQATIHNRRLEKVSGDVLTAVLSTVAMQSPEDSTTHLRCSVVRVPVRNGVVSVDRTIAMETSRAAMSASGSIDFRDERLDLGVNLVGRNGPSLGAGSLSGLVRVRGTMAEPEVGADAAGIAGGLATVAGAVATGGLSLLAQGLISQIAADRSTCRTALEMDTGGETRKVALGNAGSRDDHGLDPSAGSRDGRRGGSAASPAAPNKTTGDGS